MTHANRSTRNWAKDFARAIATTGFILCFTFSASASSDGGWKTTGWLGYEGQGDTNIDDPSGDYNFWLLSGGFTSTGKVTDSLVLAARADYRVIGYDFKGPGDPLDEVHVFRVNPTLTYKLNDKWSLMGGPSLQLSAEFGADAGDSLTGGGSFGVGYRMNDDLSMAFGVVVTSQLEESAWIQPFILVNWRISEYVSFNMEARNSRGGDVRFTYALEDNWDVSFGGGFRRERFRLDENGAVDEGILQEESIVLNLQVTYKFNEKLALDAYGGTTVDGKLRIENGNGDLLKKSDYDNVGYGGLRLRFGF